MNAVLEILNRMYDEGLEAEYVSPNFVADYAADRGFRLTSADVVFISDVYGEDACPTGRANELESEACYVL